MKIVALNLNHKASLRAIKPRLVEVVEHLKADVLTLNEYVHAESRQPLVQALAHIGLAHVQVSERLNGNNQVLVASRHPVFAGELRGPETSDAGGESNFLHVTLPYYELELVGVRAPAYESSAELRAYWGRLNEIIKATKSRRIIFLGDLNADPDKARGIGSAYLAALKTEGWLMPSPVGQWSYVSGSRIDHAIASPSVSIESAEYIAEIGGILIASQAGEAAITDHAALAVNVRVAGSAA